MSQVVVVILLDPERCTNTLIRISADNFYVHKTVDGGPHEKRGNLKKALGLHILPWSLGLQRTIIFIIDESTDYLYDYSINTLFHEMW